MNAYSDDPLIIARLIAYVLNDVCKELRLGNLAERFHGDQAEDWAVHSPHHVVIIKHGKGIGEATIDSPNVQIVIPDNRMLVRHEHQDAYNPADYGIIENIAEDWKGEKQPDLVIDWEIPPGLVIHRGPRMAIPRTIHRTKVRVLPSLR